MRDELDVEGLVEEGRFEFGEFDRVAFPFGVGAAILDDGGQHLLPTADWVKKAWQPSEDELLCESCSMSLRNPVYINVDSMVYLDEDIDDLAEH